MIDAILQAHLQAPVSGLRVLDVGCGNGDIACYFRRRNSVVGVDVSDQRRPEADFAFRLVDSPRLPFPESSFDVVISNHVIEHIPEQGEHLDELRRVLAPDGVAYLATPNRSSPVMEGHVGNPHVLRWEDMAPLFKSRGFASTEMSVQLLSQPDRFHGEVRVARFLPPRLLRLLRPWFPSHIFILEPVAQD